MRRWIALACTAASLGLGCFSPEPLRPSVDVRFPEEVPVSVVIRSAVVLDVASGALSSPQDVLLQDGVIAALGIPGSLTADLTIDGTGATLVPGLVDMHGHVSANTDPSWNRGFPDPEGNLRAYAYAGVTTVFDPADGSGDAFTRRARVAKRELVGPRIFTTGPLITCPDGHPVALIHEIAPWWIAWYIARFVAVEVADAEEVESAVDAIARDGADAIKIVIDSIPLQAPRMTPELARAVVRRAESNGLRVVAHIGTTEDAIVAAEAGVALWAHGVYKERIPDDESAVLAGFDIPMVTTTEVFDRYARGSEGPIVPTRMERETVPASVLESFYPIPDDFEVGSLAGWLDLARETRDTRIDNVRRLRAAGVTILAGSDTQSGVFPGAGLHRELGHLVRAGFTPTEAIRAATLDPARFLEKTGDPSFGTAAVGKRADLLLVEGDPTQDVAVLANLREVFLAGVPIVRTPVPAP